MTDAKTTPADDYEYVVVTEHAERAQYHVALRRLDQPEWLQIVSTFHRADRAEIYADLENMFLSDFDDRGPHEESTPVPAAEDVPGYLGELLRIVQTRVTETTHSIEMRSASVVAPSAPLDGQQIAAWKIEVLNGNTRLGFHEWSQTHRFVPHEEAAPALPAPQKYPKELLPLKETTRMEPLASDPPPASEPPPPASEAMPPEQASSPVLKGLSKATLGDAPATPSTVASRILEALPGLLEEFPKGPTANTFCQRLGLPRHHVDKAIANLGPTACVVRRLDTGGKHVVPADYQSPPEDLSRNQQAVYSALCCGVNETGIVSISKERLALVANIPPGSVQAALDGLSAKGRLMVAGGGLGAAVYQVIDENGEVVAPLPPADAPAPPEDAPAGAAAAKTDTPVKAESGEDEDLPPAPPLPPPPVATIPSAWREPPKGRPESNERSGDEIDRIIVDFGAGQVRLNGRTCFIGGRPLAIVNEIYRRRPKPVERGDLVEEVFPDHKRLTAAPMVDAQIQVANDRLRTIAAHINKTSKGYVLEPMGKVPAATRGEKDG